MSIETIISYVALLAIMFFSVQSIPAMLVGGILGRIFGMYIGALIGNMISWFLLSMAWFYFEGGPMPVAAFIGGYVFLAIHFKDDSLTDLSKITMVTEGLAIVVIAAITVTASPVIRWY